MKKIIIQGFCVLTVITIFAKFGITAHSDTDMTVPMKTLILKPPLNVKPQKNSVEFPHTKHFIKISCDKCHHKWSGSTPITTCMTSGCHDLETIPEKASSNNNNKIPKIKYYKKAYHTQCIGCHKQMQIDIEKMETSMSTIIGKIPSTGPTGCAECHPE